MKDFGITGVFNPRKWGKTTYMVKDVVRKVHSGRYKKAYFNIHVGPKVDKKGLHYGDPKIQFVNYEQLLKIKEPAPNGEPSAIVGIDQIANYLDSRRPHATVNVSTSKFMRESRQHGLDVVYTTWMRSEVDKRLRPFTDLIVFAHRNGNGFWYERVVRASGMELPRIEIRLDQAKEVWKWFDSAELIEDSTIPT